MRKFTGVVLAASFCASCGSGSDEPTAGAVNPGQGQFNDPVPVSEELISLADTSATEEAIAQGLDPEITLIPDTFNCHNIDDADFAAPDLVLSLTQDTYSSDGGTGFYETDETGLVRFAGGELDASQARVEFDSHGQYLDISRETASDLQCFQNGASHDRALHRFTLNTPEVGIYACTEGESSGDFEILEGSRYTVDSETGNFSMSDMIDSNASTISFETGPLAGLSSIYAEDPETGKQQFDLSGGTAFAAFGFPTRVNIECKRERNPREAKRFSATLAPTPPSPGTAYPTDTSSGIFFNDIGESSAKSTSQVARFFYLQRDGYMSVGIPDYQSVDCNRTLPNGLPQCHNYDTENSTLTATSATGDTETFELSVDADGSITAIDGSVIEKVGKIDQVALNGVWLNTDQFNAGCFGDDVCFSFSTQNVLRFDESGRFIKHSSDKESTKLSADLEAADAINTVGVDQRGDYNVVANRIKLRFDNGVSDDHWIYITNDDRLVIDNFIYSRQ